MNRVTFLLGAGASIPSGYSSTEELTETILYTKDYSWCTGGKFVKDTDPSGTDYTTPLVRRIIRWLNCQIHEYSQYRREVKKINYEDIYYLASQFRDDSTELQNPALLPLIRKLKCEMLSWQEYKYSVPHEDDKRDPKEQKKQHDQKFNEFLKKTCHYIEYIVDDVLTNNDTCKIKHLEIINTIHNSRQIKLNGIATLAHDTHVEDYLGRERIKFTDGFASAISGDSLRIWKNQFSLSDSIPFMKLHGSINWKHFILRQKHWNDCKYANLSKFEIGVVEPHCHDSPASRYTELDNDHNPLLLIGTFNKPLRYNWGLMLDIHYRFRKILEDSQTLIVCGYSFGDKAINSQLFFWRHAVRNRSLVVIDPRDKSKIITSARYAAGQLLKDEELTRFITKPMEEIEPDKLLRLLRLLVSS